MRIFIAADIPAPIQEWVLEQREAIQRFLPQEPRLRWTEPGGWHITLQFLGEQPDSQGVRILESMKRAAEGVAPFSIALGEPGSFAGPRSGVLWLGVATGTEPLITMAARLDPSKPLKAHVTLARSNQKIPGSILKEFQPKTACPEAVIDRIHLYESVLGPQGARYTKLQSVPLRP